MPGEPSPSTVAPYAIRAVRASETENMLALMCQCFHLQPAAAKRIFHADPFFDLRLKRVLVQQADGEIVSCLTIVPTCLSLGASKAPVPIAGIAGLCTLPNLRNRGYGAALLRQSVLAISEEFGYGLAVLTADDPRLYESIDWAACGVSITWTCDASAVPRHPNCEFVRELLPDEATDRAAEIHQTYAVARSGPEPGSFLRDKRRWRCIEELTSGRHIAILEHLGKITAYTAFDLKNKEGGKTAHIHEIVAREADDRRTMLAYFSSSTPGTRIYGYCSRRDAEILDLRSVRGLAIEVKPAVYLRLAQLENALRAVLGNVAAPKELMGFPNGLAVAIRDDNNVGMGTGDIAVLTASGGKIEIGSPGPEYAGPRISAAASAITQLIIGDKSSSELDADGKLLVSLESAGGVDRNDILAALDALFPRTEPYLALPDVF